MVDEDEESFTTKKFGIQEEETIRFNQSVYVTKAEKFESINLFILVQSNTEEELSYIDDVIYEAELNLEFEEYKDQREKQLDINLKLSGEDEEAEGP